MTPAEVCDVHDVPLDSYGCRGCWTESLCEGCGWPRHEGQHGVNQGYGGCV